MIGGGLAGCEAAWQAATRGVDVDLYEMRPQRSGPAHQTGRAGRTRVQQLAARRRARERRRLAQRRARAARFADHHAARAKRRFRPAARWPSTASASPTRSRRASPAHPRIAHASRRGRRRSRSIGRRSSPAGRCPREALARAIDACCARSRPSGRACTTTMRRRRSSPPIRSTSRRCTASRATKRATATTISTSRSTASSTRSSCTTCARCRKHEPKDFELDARRARCPTSRAACRSKRWPTRGDDTLRFGPLKPVGLRDPRTGQTPYAVVQLRKENAEGTAYNLVGFQTRLDVARAKRGLRQTSRPCERRVAAPGRDASQHVHRLRRGCSMPDLRLRGHERSTSPGRSPAPKATSKPRPAGDRTASRGARAARRACRVEFPPRRRSARSSRTCKIPRRADFQPANVTWAYFSPLAGAPRDKRERRRLMAERALAALESWPQRSGAALTGG